MAERWRAAVTRHWPAAVLVVVTGVWFWRDSPSGPHRSWRFFIEGSQLLFSGPYRAGQPAGGLHLYAHFPWLQIGPAALALAQPLTLTGPHDGIAAAQLVMSLLGLVTLGLIRRITLAARPGLAGTAGFRWSYLVGGVVFMVGWEQLAVEYAHLDDTLTIFFLVLALWAAVRHRAVAAGVAFGLAVDSKPWALVCLPLLALAGGPGAWPMTARAAGGPAIRASGRAIGVAALSALAVIAAAWAPFYLTDPGGTLSAARYTIVNMPDSALRALGVASARTPSWDRMAQAALGCALGAAALWRRRWPAVILLGVGARVALDPATRGYYTAGVLAGALIWDLLSTRRPWPVWTLVSFAALRGVKYVTHDAAVLGETRLYLIVAFTAVILLAPSRWYARDGAAAGHGQAGAGARPPRPAGEAPALPA